MRRKLDMPWETVLALVFLVLIAVALFGSVWMANKQIRAVREACADYQGYVKLPGTPGLYACFNVEDGQIKYYPLPK